VIVDFCAYLGNWPPYQLPIGNATGLIRVMDRCGIGASFVSLVDGAFLLNPREANGRIADLVAGHRDRLLPVGTVNVCSPCWRADVADGIDRLNLAGFRLHPMYQDYALDCESALALAQVLAEHQRPLFVASFIDEKRFHHPAIHVPPVPLARILGLVRHAPRTTIVLNNLIVEEASMLLEEPDLPLDNVFLDVNAMDKPFNGLTQLIEHHGSERLVYGSQVPFLYPEATLALVGESSIPEEEGTAILERNWRTSQTLRDLVESAGRNEDIACPIQPSHWN
jgi:predicted TIM-barrel fold metal-dependent hydrolase